MPGYEYVYQGINILPHSFNLIYILINGESTIKKANESSDLMGFGWKSDFVGRCQMEGYTHQANIRSVYKILSI